MLATLLAGSVAAWVPAVGQAADTPYSVLIDGRPVDAANQSALNRQGILFINVVRAVASFNGLLTFGSGGTVRVSIGGRTLLFTVGSKTAQLDGNPLTLASAPFQSAGDTFVPLLPLATLAQARLSVDRRHHQVSLTVSAGEVNPIPTPSPRATASAGGDDSRPASETPDPATTAR